MRKKPPSVDPKHHTIFERGDRMSWQNPDELLDHVKIQSDWTAADVGCGRGFFTIPLASQVKFVFAIDMKPEKLEELKATMEEFQLKNVEPLLGGKNEIPLPDERVDLLISANTLHEFADKVRMVTEMRRVLKRNGIVMISDFRKKETGFGPSISRRLSKQEVIALFERQGFLTMYTHPLRYHYLLVFTKSG